MYNYANGFRITARADGSEVLIHFVQRFPAAEDKDLGELKEPHIIEESVASIVVQTDLANELVKTLGDMLSHSDKGI